MIGERIKELRKEKGLTQRELAEKLGTTPQNIAQYEAGKRNPKKETIERIACALHVTVSDLIPDSEITVQRIEKDGTLTTIGSGWDTVREVQNEQKEKIFQFTESAPTMRYRKLLNRFNKLNFSGQDKAIEQVELLTQIPAFTKDDLQTLNNYLEFVRDKKPEYWENLKNTLQKLDSERKDTE